jgi:hypothetical protein
MASPMVRSGDCLGGGRGPFHGFTLFRQLTPFESDFSFELEPSKGPEKATRGGGGEWEPIKFLTGT